MNDESTLLLTREHPRDDLRRRYQEGRLTRVRRGAYLDLPDGVVPAQAKIRAVDRQLRAEHVFSHESAALIHGLSLWAPPRQVHVLVRSTSSGRSARDIARHTAPLPREHVTVVGGLRVTTLARTVADCALTLPALDALVIADRATLARTYDAEAAHAWVRAQGRRNGTARARAVLTAARPGTDSVRETWVRYLAVRTGLPEPQLQVPMPTRLGRYWCDLAWPEHDVYVEYDGLIKYAQDGLRPGHDGFTELVREKRRGDAVRESGINLLRFTSKDRAAEVTHRLLGAFPAALVRGLRPNPLFPPLG